MYNIIIIPFSILFYNLIKDREIESLFSVFKKSIQTLKIRFIQIKVLNLYHSYISFSQMHFLVAWQMLKNVSVRIIILQFTTNIKDTPKHNPH